MTDQERKAALLPCPFCGGNEVHMYETLGAWTVTCETTNCFGSVDDETHRWISERVAIEAWNTRAALTTSPYKDYTWEDVAMLVQENRALKEAATAQRCEWLDISDCPLGANDSKTSHVILVNKYGNICRGYRIHDGTGKYKVHDPFYNEHGQTFHPIGWMPLPAAPVDKSAEVG